MIDSSVDQTRRLDEDEPRGGGRPRRIVVVSYRDIEHPEMGGAEVIIHEVYRRLQAQGHQVTFLTCRFPGCATETRISGMRVVRIGNLYDFNFRTGPYLRRFLREEGFDVVVEDLNKLPFYTPVWVKDAPTVVNVPHLFGTTVFSQAPLPLALYVYVQEKTVPRVYAACQFQVLSESTRDDLAARGLPTERLHLVRTGIDHDYYVPPERAGRLPAPVLLYLGRLKKYKCIEFPIRVLRRLAERVPEVQYWIAGEGDYRAELETIARDEGVADRVKFLGYQDGAEKLATLHATRVLVYTSPKEGWGLSVIEANAVGVPCVASHSPGLRESVRDGETGFLVKHGDLDALAARLHDLLTDDPLWQRTSERGLAWAAEFSWESMAGQTLEVLELAIARHRNGVAA